MSYNHAGNGSERNDQGSGQPSTAGLEQGASCSPMNESARSEPLRLFHDTSEARLHKNQKSRHHTQECL